MSCLRTTYPEDESPWLLAQWDPCTTDPSTGTSWRNRPMSGHHMKKSRETMMKLPPLNLREGIDFCSDASRRNFPGLITTLGVGKENEEFEKALGNWKTKQQMEMHCSAHDERLLFAANT